MSSVSTFGTFTMARLGIWVAQQSLNITGNNISNVNTEGYSRQSANLYNIAATGADRYQAKFDIRISGGAVVDNVNQMRDQYLDIRYRDEQASVGAMDAKLDGLNQLAQIFDEVGRGDDSEGLLEARLEYMIQQVESLHAQGAGMDEFDSMFRESATVFVELIGNRAGQLERLTENISRGFYQDLDTVNSLLTRIQNLNVSIRRSQIYGGNALEQLDERNNLIDELSEYIKIDVQYTTEHLGENLDVDKLTILTGNAPQRTLVDGIYATQLSVRQVQAKDADGNLLYKTDENGKDILDDNGDKIPVMIASPNYDIDLAAMSDAYGRLQTAQQVVDLGPLTVTEKVILGDGFNVKGYLSGQEGATVFPDYETIKAVADYMNEREEYTEVEGVKYWFHISKNGSNEYVLHRHNMTNASSAEDTNTSYEWVVVDYEVDKREYEAELAASESAVSVYTLKTEAEAAARIAEGLMGTKETDDEGNVTEYSYSVEEHDGGGYEIHQIKTVTGVVELNDTELYGALQSERETLTEKGVYSTTEDLARDPNAATKRGIPFYQKALDTLANTFADLMNKANRLDDTDRTLYVYDDPENKFYEYETDDDGKLKLDEDGNKIPVIENGYYKWKDGITEKDFENASIVVDEEGYYTLQPWAVKAGYSGGGALFSNDGRGNDLTNITASNISISASWGNGSFRVLTSTKPDAASRENDNLARILNILTEQHEYTPQMDGLNTGADTPDSKLIYFTGSFQELLTTHMTGSLATDQMTTKIMLDNYNVVSDELFVNRDAVMGVDLNDEAVNMMMYQKSYAAACRLMTMYDEMLDKLINGT